MGNNSLNFGQGLKRARKKAGYKTQESFAEEIHKSIETVRNWEQGKNKPSLDDFLSLCEFFNCDADYLLNNLDEETHTLDYICKYTGLSRCAVDRLHWMRRSAGLDYLSGMIEDFSYRITESLVNICNHTREAETALKESIQKDGNLSKLEDTSKELKLDLFFFAELSRDIIETSFGSYNTLKKIDATMQKLLSESLVYLEGVENG